MLFTSLDYAILLLSAFTGYWYFSDRRFWRVLILLVASYIFYASWNEKYLLLIFFSSSLDFFLGRGLARTAETRKRKLLLTTSLVVNLGILCTFKYFNFFAFEFTRLLAVFGVEASPWVLGVLLPVGISFYTFQTLSYTIDVYRRKLEPCEHYLEYLLFVSFFPQLVAGPIVRASTLLPQIARKPFIDANRGSRALLLICIGLVKKIVIADYLAVHLVDKVFSAPEMYSSLENLAAVYGYAFQIYADFSAYSDIAIGSAALLGFDIPLNFDAPYRASDLRDFWRRWHISLSTWLRDYLYIPLGGSQKGPRATYVNLMITMLLGGLWHGAALTFVVWGAIHGLALVVTRLIQRSWSRIKSRAPKWLAAPLKGAAVVFTFHVVCAAWIFFRSPNFEIAFKMYSQIFSFSGGYANLTAPLLGVLGLAFATHWIPKNWMEKLNVVFHKAPAPAQAAIVVAVIFGANKLAHTEVTPFIYFQF